MPSDTVASVPQGQHGTLSIGTSHAYIFRLAAGGKGKKNKKKKGSGKPKENEENDNQKNHSAQGASDPQAESSKLPVRYYSSQIQLEAFR